MTPEIREDILNGKIASTYSRDWRYVYELAKDLNLSRQVINLHLKRLEKAGFVESDLRLDDDDMRAKKFFRLKEFEVYLSIEDIKQIFE